MTLKIGTGLRSSFAISLLPCLAIHSSKSPFISMYPGLDWERKRKKVEQRLFFSPIMITRSSSSFRPLCFSISLCSKVSLPSPVATTFSPGWRRTWIEKRNRRSFLSVPTCIWYTFGKKVCRCPLSINLPLSWLHFFSPFFVLLFSSFSLERCGGEMGRFPEKSNESTLNFADFPTPNDFGLFLVSPRRNPTFSMLNA